MSDPVAVRILDREYLVGCTPEEREGLMSAATLLDSRMRELRSSNRMAGIDRIAVLAALNLAFDVSDRAAPVFPSALAPLAAPKPWAVRLVGQLAPWSLQYL